MEASYTLVWTDYNDNFDDHRGLIQKCLEARAANICGKRQTYGMAMLNGRLSVRLLRNRKRNEPDSMTLTKKTWMTSSMNTKMKSVTRFTAAMIP